VFENSRSSLTRVTRQTYTAIGRIASGVLASSILISGLTTGLAAIPTPALALSPIPPATVVNQPPVAPLAGAILSVFPSRDFVTTINWPKLTTGTYTINVIRNGVNVASAVTADPNAGINHPGGVCWDTVTPDIRPGDVVRITDPNGVANQTTTQALSIGTPTADANGNLVVHGTAASAGGNPVAVGAQFPAAQVEARILSPKGLLYSTGRRDVRTGAGKQGTLTYDAPTGTNWTAVFPIQANGGVITPGDVSLATDPASQPTAIWLGTGTLTESTNTELIGAGRGIVAGPQAPCTAPLAKGPSIPTLAPASDSGVAGDNITNIATPTFTGVPGSVGAGATINLHVDGAAAAAGSTTVSPTLTYSVAPGVALADGVHSITVGEVDPVSGVETLSNGALSVTIDTAAPAVPATPALAAGSDSGASATDNITNVTLPSFTGTAEAGSSVSLSVDGAARATGKADAAGNYTIALTGTALADGVRTIAATATDVAGNASTASTALSVTIRTAAPTVPTVTGPASPTNVNTPSFTFTSDAGVTFQCSLSTGADKFAACPVGAYAAQPDGSYTFKARAIDVAGNSSVSAPFSLTIDTVAPIANISANPPSVTNNTKPSFSFASDAGSTFQCSLTSGAASFSACTSPFSPAAALVDGSYTFSVKATDLAGNAGTATNYPFTVDTVAPSVTVLTVSPSSVNTPSFSFAASEKATSECYLAQASLALNTAAFAACTSPVTFGVVADGNYTFRVRASDAAGNVGPITAQALTVSTAAPPPVVVPGVPTGLAATAASTSQINLSWAAVTGASGYHVYRDNAATATATVTAGTTFSDTGLAAGSTHSYTVDAFNSAGNSARSASVSMTTQAAAPPPAGTISAPTAPKTTLVSGGTLSSTGGVPVTITWTAPTTLPTGTSTVSYAVEQKTGTGAFTLVKTVTTTSTTLTLATGSTYQVRVKATAKDVGGVALGTSAYATGAAFAPSTAQETTTAAVYSGTWTSQAVTGSFGGSVKFAQAPAATSTGPSVTFTFTGTRVSWVATKGPDRGKASVSVDGGTPVTVDLYSATLSVRREVFAKNGLATGTHKVTVKVLGTHSSAAATTSPNRIDIDGFVIVQ
jgi:hypothetical protein